jgi:iron complex transport system ATP-binding protein
MIVRLDQLTVAYGESHALDRVSGEFHAGEFTAIVGPNGAGKSTLLSAMSGWSAAAGRCLWDGRDVRQWPRREFARQVAYVPQNVDIAFPFSVEDVVLMGRMPYARGLFESDEDRGHANEAMRRADVWRLRERDVRTLSGGERQRVLLAAALAQQPAALLLDEPAAFLDLQHQLAVFTLLRDLARQGLLVVAVTHDLNLASRYASRVWLLACGQVMGQGPAPEVLTPELVGRVFGVRVARGPDGWLRYEALHDQR